MKRFSLEEKTKAVSMYLSGMNSVDVATKLGASSPSVIVWVKKFAGAKSVRSNKTPDKKTLNAYADWKAGMPAQAAGKKWGLNSGHLQAFIRNKEKQTNKPKAQAKPIKEQQVEKLSTPVTYLGNTFFYAMSIQR